MKVESIDERKKKPQNNYLDSHSNQTRVNKMRLLLKFQLLALLFKKSATVSQQNLLRVKKMSTSKLLRIE